MLTGETIICLSSIDWKFNWQGHQEIMLSLAQQGNRVLFVENTGVRAARLRDLERLRQRVRDWRLGVRGVREEQQNLSIYSPIVLPFPYSRLAQRINRVLFARVLPRWMLTTGHSRPIVWTFLPTPLALELTRQLDAELTIYYCIDDLPSSSPAAQRLWRSERELLRTANLVFVTSQRLEERARRLRSKVHVFPFGVSLRRFDEARREPTGVPADVRDLKRPVVGYVGGLNQKLDQELLVDIIARLPEASFVLIGPIETNLSRLSRCSNLRLLGPRPHDQIPQYLGSFDVGIIPYRLTDYTSHIYPAKLNEYLAMGLPVVATPLYEVQRFNDAHGTLVRVAEGGRAFADAIREATLASSPSERAGRIAVARQNSWETRITEMTTLIAAALRRCRTCNGRSR